MTDLSVSEEMSFLLYMSEDRCTMVEVWEDGVVRVVTRPEPDLMPLRPIIVTPESEQRRGRREEDAYPRGWVHLSPETYDLFHDGYGALADALVRARAFVAQIAPAALLSQIDDALAMKSNLNERR